MEWLVLSFALGAATGWVARGYQRIPSGPVVTAAPVIAPSPAAKAVRPPTVTIIYMDRDERTVCGTEAIDARLRRPVRLREGRRFICAREDGRGRYIYREAD
jgi:hypothetical protein